MKNSNRLGVVPWSISPGHPHAAQTDCRDFQPLRTQPSFLHSLLLFTQPSRQSSPAYAPSGSVHAPSALPPAAVWFQQQLCNDLNPPIGLFVSTEPRLPGPEENPFEPLALWLLTPMALTLSKPAFRPSSGPARTAPVYLRQWYPAPIHVLNRLLKQRGLVIHNLVRAKLEQEF